MNTITIPADSPVGREITALAAKYAINPGAVTSGLLCGICDKHRRAAAAAAAIRPDGSPCPPITASLPLREAPSKADHETSDVKDEIQPDSF